MSNKVIGIDPDARSSTDAREVNGWVAEKVNRKQFNQMLFQSVTNHVWGTENQVKSSKDATFYTDGSGNPLDASDSAVTIENQDKILIKHNVTQTANLLLDAGGKKFRIEMYQGVTLDMSTFDLTIGGTGDQVSGALDVTGSGTATIEESAGLRVTTSGGIAVANLAGDIIVNNTNPATTSANIDAKDLKIEYVSASVVKITADSLKLVSSDNQSVVVNNISASPDIATVGNRQNGASELSDAWYNIWAGATSGGALEYKYVPVLTGTTDGTTANELVDSSEDFTTHLAAIGDKVFNDTDGTFAFVTAVTNAASGRLELDADIFASGEDYTIELRSPTFSTGYTFLANIGSVENVSGNFDRPGRNGVESTTYTNDQNEKYSGQPKDVEILKDGGVWIKNQCTAWVVFDGTAGVPVIIDSYNVASVARTATGRFQINFSTPMDSINYTISGGILPNTNTIGNVSLDEITAQTLIAAYIRTGNHVGTYNSLVTTVLFFGGKN